MTMPVRKAIIPCGGVGTRLLPITKVVPKELLPIGARPAIDYIVEEAVEAGVEEIFLVCHPSKTAIAEYFRPDPELNRFLEARNKGAELAALRRVETMARITTVFQHEPRGLGHAVLCARDAVADEPFLVLLPDRLVIGPASGTAQLVAACERYRQWGLLLEEVDESAVHTIGVIRGTTADDGTYDIRGAVEKPRPADAPSRLSILGRYLLPPEIFPFLAAGRPGALGELQLTDAIDRVARSLPGRGVVCQGTIYDIGTAEGLAFAQRNIAS